MSTAALPSARLAKLRTVLRDEGPGQALLRAVRAAAYRAALRPFDEALDARLARSTGEKVSVAALAVDSANARYGVEYAPTPGRLFRAMVESLPQADVAASTFVDFGSGKGRVVCLASQLPFREVVGVEFSQALHRDAQANIAAFLESGAPRCRSVRSVAADATAWAIPDGPCVLYFYNPFHEPVMAEVIGRIGASWRRRPRKMHLIYYNPAHRSVLDAADFLKPRAPSLACRAAVAMASPHALAMYETL